MSNCKCWDLATGEKPVIKKQHNNIQPYRTKAAHFSISAPACVKVHGDEWMGEWVLWHYKIIGNLLCIAGEITLGELTEGSMTGCINRLKEEKKSVSFTTYWHCIAELDTSQSFILYSPGSCECRKDLMGFTSLYFFFSYLSFPIHTRSPGCCTRSVVKTTAHSGSAGVSICLSDCTHPSIIICLVLSHTKILCRVKAALTAFTLQVLTLNFDLLPISDYLDCVPTSAFRSDSYVTCAFTPA